MSVRGFKSNGLGPREGGKILDCLFYFSLTMI